MTLSDNSHRSAPSGRRAFTLIELLVVISIMALLAAMIFPITKAVNRNKIRSKARAELGQVETAIESYKNKLGHYPPDNPNPLARFQNPLYYELVGTFSTNFNGPGYSTLDRSAQITTAQVGQAFGIGGFVNSMAGSGASEEGRTARNFLPGLKPNQVGELQAAPVAGVKLLTSSILRQDMDFRLFPGASAADPKLTINPFFYNSSNPTNNPNSYDLWIDVIVDGRTNRICNWSKEPLLLNGPE